jgi:hypothetical protein
MQSAEPGKQGETPASKISPEPKIIQIRKLDKIETTFLTDPDGR